MAQKTENSPRKRPKRGPRAEIMILIILLKTPGKGRGMWEGLPVVG